MTPMKSWRGLGPGDESGDTAQDNRKEKRDYDRALYKLRHLVENGFLEFKQWRGVRPGMPRTPFLTWPSARFGPWRFGLNYFDDTP